MPQNISDQSGGIALKTVCHQWNITHDLRFVRGTFLAFKKKRLADFRTPGSDCIQTKMGTHCHQ